MSEARRPLGESFTVEEISTQAVQMLDQVVRNACLHCHYQPAPNDIERFRQRIILLLIEDDYRRLRTYDQQASLKTWLLTVANHEVSRLLKQERKNIGLEDAPPETFNVTPKQEESLLRKEQEQLLAAASQKLTARERKLYDLIQEDVKPDIIAQALGLKLNSVYRMKNALVKKLQELVIGGGRGG